MRVVFDTDVELVASGDEAVALIGSDRIYCAGGGFVDNGNVALMCACDRHSGTVQAMTFLDGLPDGAYAAVSRPVLLDEDRLAQAVVVQGHFVKVLVIDRGLRIVSAQDLTYADHTMPELIGLADLTPTALALHVLDDGELLFCASDDRTHWLRRLRADFSTAWSSREHVLAISDGIALLSDGAGTLRALDLDESLNRWSRPQPQRVRFVDARGGALLFIEQGVASFVATLMSAQTGEVELHRTLHGVFESGFAGGRGLCVVSAQHEDAYAVHLRPENPREWRVTNDAVALADELLLSNGGLLYLDEQRDRARRLRVEATRWAAATVDDDLVVLRVGQRLIGVRWP